MLTFAILYFMKISTWQEQHSALVKEFTFTTFAAAIEFINHVATIAERLNHHPEIKNTYTSVTLRLSTHDAGDIVTEKDHALATAIDELSI